MWFATTDVSHVCISFYIGSCFVLPFGGNHEVKHTEQNVFSNPTRMLLKSANIALRAARFAAIDALCSIWGICGARGARLATANPQAEAVRVCSVLLTNWP